MALREAFAERHSDELNCVRSFRTKQDGSLEECITRFMNAGLSASGVDDLAKARSS